MKVVTETMTAALVAAALTISVNAVAQNIPQGALAINDSGPWAGSFDELNHALAADFLYNPQGAVIKKLTFQGPFTVFAPTDGAFEALKQVLACNGIALSDVPDIARTTLAYHGVKGMYLAADVVGLSEIETLAGAVINQDGGVLTDVAGQQVNILATDIVVDNGVVHVVDTVLLPADLGLLPCGS